jgi:hypothetical protein
MTSIEDRLIAFLNSVPALDDKENRNLLLSRFPDNLVSTVDWAGSKAAYISQLVGTAAKWGWLETESKSSLELIVDNVEKFRLVSGLMLEEDLATLKTYFQSYSSGEQVKRLNIAVIAMLGPEAREMEAGTLWEDLPFPPGECQLVNGIKGISKDHLDELVSCYHETDRNQWTPLLGERQPINKIVSDAVGNWSSILQYAHESYTFDIHFYSNEFFSSNGEERTHIWNLFEQEGGILIIDALSMCHPKVRQMFLNCQLMSSNNPVSMIVISPSSPTDKDIDQLFERHIYASHLEKAFGYYANQLLPAYQFGVDNIYNLRRWLSHILSNIDQNAPSPEVRKAIRTERTQPPRGMIQRFIKTGVSR